MDSGGELILNRSGTAGSSVQGLCGDMRLAVLFRHMCDKWMAMPISANVRQVDGYALLVVRGLPDWYGCHGT